MSELSNKNQTLADLTPTLVGQLRDGHVDAAGMLTNLYHQPLLRFCFGYLGNQDEAADAVQEVFLNILQHDTLPQNFRAWIYRIARNRCLDLLRSRRRRCDDKTMPPASRIDADLTGDLTRMVRSEQQARLGQLLADLPETQREILRLRYTEELSRVEIAEVLDLPESLVKSRLYEGLVKLRRHDSLLDIK